MKLLLVLTALAAQGKALSEDEILRGADERIRKHRTGEVELKLVDSEGRPVAEGLEVRIEQQHHAFLFGCNIFKLGRCRTEADNREYEKRFAELLNFATLPFYWWSYERERGKPDHERTERILRWCGEHRITAKGHPLAWNFVDPKWLPKDPERAMTLQYARIGECARRFRGRMPLWDVVNEATHYDRPELKQRAPTLTAAISKTGVAGYLLGAFRAAREADPGARLIINDYRTDADYERKVISVLVDENGKPLYDVIGIQSHQHGGAWTVRRIWDVCERFARFGKPLHFTETTFLSGRTGWELKRKEPGFTWPSTPEGERRQAREAARFYTVLFSHPAVEAITWWDFSDQGAWQGAPAGLIRADMTPKPAYLELKRLIREKWWTRTSAKTTAGGSVSFHGTFGGYKVSARSKGREMTGTFSFGSGTREALKITLK